MKTKDQLLTLYIGHSQLVAEICKEIGFRDTINKILTWDHARTWLSPSWKPSSLIY